jgi:hypothetical protein
MSRKSVALSMVVFGLLSTIGCSIVTRWRRSMSDLTLTISLPRLKFALGENVNPKVAVANQTSQLVLFSDIREGLAPQPTYWIERPDGTTAVYDPNRGRPAFSGMNQVPRTLLTGIEPGASLDTTVLLTLAVSLDLPGRYTIRARFKWDKFDLDSEPISFTIASIHIANAVLHELVRDPDAPRVANPDEPATWSHSTEFYDFVSFQTAEGIAPPRIARAWVAWSVPEPLYDRDLEWELKFGEDISISREDMPTGSRLLPCQATGSSHVGIPLDRMAWTDSALWLGWPEGNLKESTWHRIASPKTIGYGLRFVSAVLPKGSNDIDAFVVFQGEGGELGHVHVGTSFNGDKETEGHGTFRAIAQLGPDLVGAQVMRGQPEMGSPIIVAAVRSVPTGAVLTFLRVDGNGAIVGKAQRGIAGFRPLGPVAMTTRVHDSMVEAAFPALDKYQGTLHVLRVAATVALRALDAPITSKPIPIQGPTASMAINYSRFPPFFPNGVGLLLRQPGDRAFFWTEARGLKPLPFTLRDKDEALLIGKRSAWYVLVSDGTRLHGEAVESFFNEHRPKPTHDPYPNGAVE